MPTLRIPSPLRPFAEGISEIELTADTVSAALDELTVKYPSLRAHLFTEDGEMRAFVNLFLNDEDVRHLQGVDTKVNVNDRLMIIPSIAGGGST